MKNLLTLAALLLMVAGCATSSTDAARRADAGEICHVCQHNNDLACVCVKVKENTPRTEYHGATYYFCSDYCRVMFVKNPARYLPKASAK
jgi:YHS domain-containing protein